MRAGWRLPKPLNPLSLRDFPLSGGHRLHYIPAGGSTAAIFKENLADVLPRRLMPPGNLYHIAISAVWLPHNYLGYSIPSPVKFTWNMLTLYRYLWATIPFPVETNCPHRERQPPFYTTVGHILVPGEFHEDKCGA